MRWPPSRSSCGRQASRQKSTSAFPSGGLSQLPIDRRFMANSQRLTPIQWTICVIAAIGFAFDTYELLMLPLVLPPALAEMLHVAPGTPEFNHWRGLMFFIP